MEFIQYVNFLKRCLILFCFFLFASIHLKAGTWLDSFGKDTQKKSKIELSTGYDFASDAITNKLASSYFFARFINTDMKDEVSKNLFAVNRFGADAGYAITYSQQLDKLFQKEGFSWNIGIADLNHLHSSFTRDAFEIYFRGNSPYAGKTAELGEFDFSLLHYQQFTIGLSKESKGNRRTYLYQAGISFNKGQKFQSIHSDRANLFTSADAEFLDIDFNIHLRGSDSSRTGLGSMNGIGGSVHLAITIQDEDKNEFSVRLSNLGFIQFNDKSYSVPADSLFRFEGIDASSLFDFSDSISTNVSSDSAFVQGFLHRRKNESFQYNLPGKLSLNYCRHLNNQNSINIGLEQIFFSSYLPHGWFRFEHQFKERHRLGVMLGYGGYTLWQAGLSYEVKIGQTWFLKLASQNLSGWLNTKSGRAQGAFVSFSKYL